MSDSQGLGLGFAVGDASIFGTGQLADAFGIVKAKLQQVASNDGLFVQAFGDKANTVEFQSVRGQWAIGDFSQLPSVQVISAADMNGADGAYASSTQKIYLSDAAFGMGAAVTLIEEIGHFLDAKVGQDTVGDEGERFASSVFELQLSADQLSRINNEDDRGFVTVDGESVSVEQALINGNNSNNTLNGTNSDDVINGYSGNDTIYANGGNDLVYGGGNDDRLWGGTGNDKLWGEDGADELRGDDGNDELRGGNQDDRLWGGNQDDRLWGEEGNDQLIGDAGNDLLAGGNGDDKIWGSAGNDQIWGERGNDQLTGDDGSDVLNGYGFADNERDTLIGGTGADRFVLGDANSIFYAKNGSSDYAVIADFNRGEGDVIALKKLAFNNSSGDRAYGYRLVTVGVNTEVRADNTNELVGVLQNRTGVSLLQGFSFEGTPALRTGQANTDVDGDGKDDIVAFGLDRVYVSLSNGDGTFKAPIASIQNFAKNTGWTSFNDFPRTLADINGDGKADIVGFGTDRVWVSLSNGNGTFQNPVASIQNFAKNTGWTSFNDFPRTLADVNGDGKADIVGFGTDNVWVSLSNGNTTFQNPVASIKNFTKNSGGWANFNELPRMLADVNGDGKADIVGFGTDNVWVSLSNGNTTFQNPVASIKNFTKNSGGWTNFNDFPRALADINGDGKADIVGFGGDNVFVSLSNGNTTFQNPLTSIQNFTKNSGGWTNFNELPRLAGVGSYASITSPIGLMATSSYLTQLSNGTLIGKYSKNVDNSDGFQCWDLVADAAGINSSSPYYFAHKWKRGENVIANGNVAVGTAIATFAGTNNTYYGAYNHTGIFAGYRRNSSGVIDGFWMWEQNAPVGSAIRKGFYPITSSGVSDADNYYVIRA